MASPGFEISTSVASIGLVRTRRRARLQRERGTCESSLTFDFDTKRRRAGRGIAFLVRVMLPAAHPLRLTETKFPLVFRVLGALDWRPARQNRGCGDPASRLAGEGTLLCCWASRVQGPRRDLASTSSPRPRPPREPSASRAGNDTRILSGCGRSEDNVQ